MTTRAITKVYNLIGFWENDIWDLSNCGLTNIEECMKDRVSKYRYLKFSNINNEIIKQEMKYFIHSKLLFFKGSINLLKDSHLSIYTEMVNFLGSGEISIESLEDIDDSFMEKYVEYLNRKNINTTYRRKRDCNKSCNNFRARFPCKLKTYFRDLHNDTFKKNPDKWNVHDFNISSHRINLSRDIKTLRFYSLDNENNKIIFKEYITYLFYNTNISLAFIYSKFNFVRHFIEYMGKKNLEDYGRKDIENYRDFILDTDIDNGTYNIKMIAISDFLGFGMKKKYWSNNDVFLDYDIFDTSFKIKGNTVGKEVIEAILNNADKFPKKEFTMFLILYCCGMRISEVCILQVGSLLKDNRGYYIVFYQQKMKKEVSNPIPENLYNHIMEYQNELIKELGEDQVYLFPKADGTPILSGTFRERMITIIKEIGIFNKDGSEYIFRAHEYRHTFATNLLEKDVPFTVIQKLLHHNSPEMSLVYAQVTDSRKQKKYSQFIDLLGEKSSNLFENNEEADRIYEVQWLKNNLKAQALPNGFCSLPVSLGQCPYANSCLTCEHFKTTIKHLKILKKQFFRTEQLIHNMQERNITENLEVNFKVRENLLRIITSIEEGD